MSNHKIRDEEIDEVRAESDDLYWEGLWSDSADDVESSNSDYIPPTPPEQRNCATTPVVCVSDSDDWEGSDDKPNKSDSESRDSDFDDVVWVDVTEIIDDQLQANFSTRSCMDLNMPPASAEPLI
jgi:hypothetical protein